MGRPNGHLLLIQCRDEKGIIAKVTGALHDADCNIVTNREFVEDGEFFMRTVFSGDADHAALSAWMRTLLPPGAEVRMPDRQRKRVVLLGTKEPHCLGDLLLRASSGDLNMEVPGVVGSREDLRALSERFDVPFHHVPHDGDRAAHELALNAVLDDLAPDVLVLAKYMRILSPDFVARWHRRIVNIHHSFLPAFSGARPYRQAWERGVKIIGATAHLVTDDLDEGPILSQDVIPVDHRRGPREMAAAGRDVEKTVLARALRYVLDDRVFVFGRRTIIFD